MRDLLQEIIEDLPAALRDAFCICLFMGAVVAFGFALGAAG